ncbi:MAG TPA: acyltransferase family protein [Puia sp.]|nr:acyltransferase family protein [Puia sp.]
MEQALSSDPSDLSRPSALGPHPTSAHRPISASSVRPQTPTCLPAGPVAPLSLGRESGFRLLFIDNIRWVMIMLVLSMHAAVTYGGHGSWYVKGPAHLGLAQDLTILTYQIFLQSFFMGFLFFIAGYFVPGAYDKKGARRFLRDRGYRLGLPSLLFIFVIQPIACYYAAGVWDTDHGFWGAYQHYILHGSFLSGSGPLWFCLALLFFCVVYAGWRKSGTRKPGTRPSQRGADGPTVRGATGPTVRGADGPTEKPAARPIHPTPFPRAILVAGFIGLITLCTFLARIPWPMGTSFYNMQFCYFSQYVAFFIAGTLAYRHSWLSTLSAATSKRWGFIGLFGGLAIWITLIALNITAKTYHPFDGGWHWQSLGMCAIDALAGTGISIGLLGLFRERFNRQGRWAVFFSASAFAVYVFHTPILIGITRLLTDLHWLPLLKFGLATVLCIIATYVLCAFVFRRLPLVKNIL